MMPHLLAYHTDIELVGMNPSCSEIQASTVHACLSQLNLTHAKNQIHMQILTEPNGEAALSL